VAGQGGAEQGMSGDLYVFIHVKEHDIFERDGNNVTCEVPISYVQAVFGDEVEVRPWMARP